MVVAAAAKVEPVELVGAHWAAAVGQTKSGLPVAVEILQAEVSQARRIEKTIQELMAIDSMACVASIAQVN